MKYTCVAGAHQWRQRYADLPDSIKQELSPHQVHLLTSYWSIQSILYSDWLTLTTPAPTRTPRWWMWPSAGTTWWLETRRGSPSMASSTTNPVWRGENYYYKRNCLFLLVYFLHKVYDVCIKRGLTSSFLFTIQTHFCNNRS